MERKNLLLAAILLVGMNCPVNTNTANMAANIVWSSVKQLAYVGALGAGYTAAGAARRIMYSDPHTTNQIGFVDVKANAIKHIEVKVRMGQKPILKTCHTWTEKDNGQAKVKFLETMKSKLKMDNKASAEFSYEISIVLNKNNERVLLSGKLEETHITLEGSNLVNKLWDNVISHYLILQSECKNTADNDWKPATQLPNISKCSVEHSTEMSNSHYIHTAGSIGSMVAPIAAVSYAFGGIPKTWGQATTYGIAAGTGYILDKMFYDAGPGVDFKLAGPKQLFTSSDPAEVNRLVEGFIVEQSVINFDNVTFQEWQTEENRLIAAHRAAPNTAAKGTIEDDIMAYANEAQTFLRTDVVTLTDNVSGLELAYAPIQTQVKTGLIAPDNIYVVGDLVPELSTGDLRTRIGRLATTAGNGLSKLSKGIFGGNTRHRRRGGARGHRTL